MKNIIDKLKGLPRSKKVQLTAAMILTAALLIEIPVFAWFTNQRKAAEMYKVNNPNSLILSAAHREDSTNFEINGVNADEILVDGEGSKILDANQQEQKITHKYYVFNVTGDSVSKFTIQLAYTTNNPFTYELYAANELTERPAAVPQQPVDYVEYTLTGETVEGIPQLSGEEYHLSAAPPENPADPPTKLYYQIDHQETDGGVAVAGKYNGHYLNSTNGTNANSDPDNSYYEMAYDTYTNTHQNAKPVYWQATNVSAIPGTVNSNKIPFSRHFILKVSWPAGSLDNTAKETDIVYITVKATS